jgi:hypothetical protein
MITRPEDLSFAARDFRTASRRNKSRLRNREVHRDQHQQTTVLYLLGANCLLAGPCRQTFARRQPSCDMITRGNEPRNPNIVMDIPAQLPVST